MNSSTGPPRESYLITLRAACSQYPRKHRDSDVAARCAAMILYAGANRSRRRNQSPAAASSASARIIAAGIVIAFCYWASTVLVTLIVAVLMAYFLDPVVTWLEEWHIPRALGSLIVVLSTICADAVLAWTLILRVDQFGAGLAELPEALARRLRRRVSKETGDFRGARFRN